MDKIIQLASEHWETLTFVGGYLLFGLVAHLPKPGSKVTFYEFFYDYTRTILNLPAAQRFQIPNDQVPGAQK